MRILVWHVHGAWTTALVQGEHEYLVPVLPGRGPDGRGRARTYRWPDRAVEVTPGEAAEADVDVVILQRPEELRSLAERWLGGRRPGRDVPAVYVQHNAPQGRIAEMRHPYRDRDDLVLCHVTHFNDLFWDAGTTRTVVIEHGIVDPGARYTGALARAAAVINEAPRRGRVTGTDLLGRFRRAVPVDLFGIDADQAFAAAADHDADRRRDRLRGRGRLPSVSRSSVPSPRVRRDPQPTEARSQPCRRVAQSTPHAGSRSRRPSAHLARRR